MHVLVIAVTLLIVGLVLLRIHPEKTRSNLLKELTTMKTHTVNILNKILKVDTTKLVDFHIPNVHCDGLISKILTPDELVKLYQTDKDFYDKLVKCGYTRTVGLLHGFVLWTTNSKTKNIKSFKYFTDCVQKIEWKDPNLFIDFHTTKSKIGKCIF